MKKNKFRQYYDSLPSKAPVAPKRAFVFRIMDLCKVNENTVRGWLAGTYKPDALRTSIIAKEMGIPEDELFA